MSRKWAVYGEQFGRVMLVEDGFLSAKAARDWGEENLDGFANFNLKSYDVDDELPNEVWR